jgi:membrane fusion protein (multidrug efflux system)
MESSTPPKVRSISEPPPAEVPAAPKRNLRPFIILGAVAGVAALGFGAYSIITAGQEETDDAQVEADVVPIAARTSGQVLKVPVKDNQAVKKGDLLLEIDDADHTARVNQAEAELETAKAQAAVADSQEHVTEASARGGLDSSRASLSGTNVMVSSAEAQVLAARAGLDRAKVDVRRSEIDLQRAKELRAANAVPQERLDNTQMAYDSSRAALAQAEANLAAVEEAKRMARSRVAEAEGRLEQSQPIDAQIAVARAGAELAHARVKSSEAQLEIAKLNLSYTRVLAPSDGVVSKVSVHEGALVQPGQPVAELVPSATYVVANFKETQVGKMRPGQRAVLKLDAFPGRDLEGSVESLSGGTGARFSLLPPDNASGNFVKVVQRVPVRIAWKAPPDLPLRAGLSADVTVYVGKER